MSRGFASAIEVGAGSAIASTIQFISSAGPQFPADTGVYNAGTANIGSVTLSPITLGPAGSLLLAFPACSSTGGQTVSSVVATGLAPNTGVSLTFTKVGGYFNSVPQGGEDIEEWSVTVSAAAAGIQMSVLVTFSASLGVAADVALYSLVSIYGTNTVWASSGFGHVANGLVSTVTYPAITSGSATAQAYVGYALLNGVLPNTGVSTLNARPFTFVGTPLNNQIVTCGNLGVQTNYQPVGNTFIQNSGGGGTTPTAAYSTTLGSVWTATAQSTFVPYITGSAVPSITHINDTSNFGTPLSTLSLSPATVGNVQTLAVYTQSTSVTAASISGGGCSSWAQVGTPSVSTTTGYTVQVFLGTVTTVGVASANVTWSGTIGGDFVYLACHEYSSGLGASTTWSVDVQNPVSTTTASTAVSFSSLSAAGSNEMYFGALVGTANFAATGTSGYTSYGAATQQMMIWNMSVSGTQAPTATMTSGEYNGVCCILIATGTGGGLTVPTTLIFDDEFNTGTLNTTIWSPQWYTSSQNNTTMVSGNVAMGSQGVALTLAANQTGAIITTNPLDGISGHTGYWVAPPTANAPVYIEWKVNSAAVGGEIANWPSVWLEGVDQQWPTQGEIDIWEGLSGQAGWHTHWGPSHGVDDTAGGGFTGTSPGLHIYGALWTTTSVTWVYDGVVVGSRVFTAGVETTCMAYEKFLIAENSIAINPPGTFASTPATVYIRYCRIWQNYVAPPPPNNPVITQVGTVNGTVGTAIPSVNLVTTGGTAPYSYTDSSLPSGVSLINGTISGTPTATFDTNVTITVKDSTSPTQLTNTMAFLMDISASSGNPIPNAPATISGVTVPTNLVFRDEFNTGTLNASFWGPVTNNTTQDNGAVMTPSNVSMGAGGVSVTTSAAARGGMITSCPWMGGLGGNGFTCNPVGGGTLGTSGPIYVEWSATFPAGLPAFDCLWLVGNPNYPSNNANPWPACGEIDVAECLGRGGVSATVHYGAAGTNGSQDSAGTVNATSGTFGVLWTSTNQYFVCNGTVFATGTISCATMNNCPQGILIEAGAANSGYPCTLTCRYVRVWQG